jgi:hypothetical protein
MKDARSQPQDLYEKYLELPAVNIQEPINPGLGSTGFFTAIAGMGERALEHGTIVRKIRKGN